MSNIESNFLESMEKMHISDNVIPLETLESIIEHNKKWAVETYEKDKYLNPMFIGYTADGKQQICIPGFFRNNREKENFVRILKLIFAAYNVDKYAVLCESWGVCDATPDVYKQYPNLSEHPDRIECLMILAVNRYGNKMCMYKINSDKKLELWYEEKGQGRFLELLPKEKISKENREILLAFLKKIGKEIK